MFDRGLFLTVRSYIYYVLSIGTKLGENGRGSEPDVAKINGDTNIPFGWKEMDGKEWNAKNILRICLLLPCLGV